MKTIGRSSGILRQLLPCAALVLAPLLPTDNVSAAPPPYTPTLAVHESSYGTTRTEHGQESILAIDIRIVSHDPSERVYRTECFFLKKGGHVAEPIVDDAAVFDVIRPHATYRVTAKPIAIKAQKTTSSRGKASKSKPSAPRPATDLPREGYVVRISSNGELLRECFSSTAISEAIIRQPGLLDPDRLRKKLRQLDAATLVVK